MNSSILLSRDDFIMQFHVTTDGVFEGGPQLEIDGHAVQFGDLFLNLARIDATMLEMELQNRGFNRESNGMYLLTADGKMALVSTKNTLNSYAKVLIEAFNAQINNANTFTRAIADAKSLKLNVVGHNVESNSYAAYLAGLYDVLNPLKSLRSTKDVQFHSSPQYLRGLLAGRHYATFAIEELLTRGICPDIYDEAMLQRWVGPNAHRDDYQLISKPELQQLVHRIKHDAVTAGFENND